MKPMIGIILRPETNKNNRDIYAIYKEVSEAVIQKGGIPIGIIPPHLKNLSKQEENDLYQTLDLCDGIIAQGGSDFYPYDLKLIQYAYDKNIPTLGICLGMQTMACLFDGVMEDVNSEVGHLQKGVRYVHDITVNKNSKLYEIIGTEKASVNSRHKSCITKTSLNVSAYSMDHIIEAVEDSTKTFFIGVEWHPEDMISYDVVANQILDYFIKVSRRV